MAEEAKVVRAQQPTQDKDVGVHRLSDPRTPEWGGGAETETGVTHIAVLLQATRAPHRGRWRGASTLTPVSHWSGSAPGRC